MSTRPKDAKTGGEAPKQEEPKGETILETDYVYGRSTQLAASHQPGDGHS